MPNGLPTSAALSSPIRSCSRCRAVACRWATRPQRLFRGERDGVDVTGKTVILVDDGLATGATMLAAVKALRTRRPGRVVVAVPVAAPEACAAFRRQVDETICLLTPDHMRAVGLWYEDFEQTSDGEVRALLERALHARPQSSSAARAVGT